VLDELRSAMRGVTRHTMFGCPATLIDRKMVACVYGDSVAMKLPVSVAASLQSARPASPFQPYDKTTMRAWVQISRPRPAGLSPQPDAYSSGRGLRPSSQGRPGSRRMRILVALWTQLEPLPLIVVNPVPMIFGLVLFGVVHAAIYGWLAHAWPAGVLRRAARFAALIFVLTDLFWEFFTPVNLFGEPFALVLMELLFWAFIATTEACVIATLMERRRSRRS
jgi:hypothetical protein